jgi:magnesium chelatase accessory protein
MINQRTPPDWWPHRDASAFVDAGGLRWHVQHFGARDATGLATGHAPGRAPVALLLHGTGAGTHSWRHLAPRLAKGFDVVAPDLPGHAFTATPPAQSLSLPGVAAALGQLLAAMQLRPALVIGHSAGAAIALRMALDGLVAPELIVSINGAILPLQGPVGRWFMPMARVMAASPLVPPAFAAWTSLPFVARRLLDSTGSRIDALGERCYAHLVRDAVHVAGALRLMASWDLPALEPELPNVRTPLLLISGERDRTLPPSHGARAAQRIPGARGLLLPRLGHLAHEEDAQAVHAAVIAAFDECAAAPRGCDATAATAC